MKTKIRHHTDPHLCLQDSTTLPQFLHAAHIMPSHEPDERLLRRLCDAFSRMPYENLTKIIKAGAGVQTGHAKRLPDTVIRDYVRHGTGGTCFSLTAACIAILDGCGFEAYPLLADRHYGSDTHCAVMFSHNARLLLLDPGYLIHQPVYLPTTEPVTITSGFQTLELCPHDAGRRVELFTIANNNRRSRLTYKVAPVDGPTFGRAWERSFTWEMMTYPVLTRYADGIHHYLQGEQLRIRSAEGTTRRTLSADDEYVFISKTLGIHPTIIKQAFSALD